MENLYLVLEGKNVRGYTNFKNLLHREKIKDSVSEDKIPFMIGDKKIIEIEVDTRVKIF